MITGFIPTTTLAAGNIFEELLRKPDGLDAAIAAAKQARSSNDPAARDQLQQLLFEAARLNPALNPGQWRYAAQDGTVATAGSHRIARGSILLVATASAMRDNPSKGYELVFGTGVHACLGKTLAMAQITEIFEVAALPGRGARQYRPVGKDLPGRRVSPSARRRVQACLRIANPGHGHRAGAAGGESRPQGLA